MYYASCSEHRFRTGLLFLAIATRELGLFAEAEFRTRNPNNRKLSSVQPAGIPRWSLEFTTKCNFLPATWRSIFRDYERAVFTFLPEESINLQQRGRTVWTENCQISYFLNNLRLSDQSRLTGWVCDDPSEVLLCARVVQ